MSYPTILWIINFSPVLYSPVKTKKNKFERINLKKKVFDWENSRFTKSDSLFSFEASSQKKTWKHTLCVFVNSLVLIDSPENTESRNRVQVKYRLIVFIK